MSTEELYTMILLIMALACQLYLFNQLSIENAYTRTLRDKIVKIQHFYEVTVAGMLDKQFRRHFRMNRNTLNNVIKYIRPNDRLFLEQSRKISVGKKIAMTVAYLGSRTPTLQLAHKFGVSESIFLKHTETVMKALCDNIHEIIQFPKASDFAAISEKFNEIGKFFPNVIGAVDGLHLEIELTEEVKDFESYSNYHQWYSIHLQGTCTYDLRFIHVFAGWPGRAHDARVYRHSELPELITEAFIPRNQSIYTSYHLVGDSAYPLQTELLTPYSRHGQQRMPRKLKTYNRHLSSKRQSIERAFGLLLKRFPRLKYLNQKSLRKKITVVLSGCILHNICIMENDNIELYLQKARRIRRPRQNFNGDYDRTANQIANGNRKRNFFANVIQYYNNL